MSGPLWEMGRGWGEMSVAGGGRVCVCVAGEGWMRRGDGGCGVYRRRMRVW